MCGLGRVGMPCDTRLALAVCRKVVSAAVIFHGFVVW